MGKRRFQFHLDTLVGATLTMAVLGWLNLRPTALQCQSLWDFEENIAGLQRVEILSKSQDLSKLMLRHGLPEDLFSSPRVSSDIFWYFEHRLCGWPISAIRLTPRFNNPNEPVEIWSSMNGLDTKSKISLSFQDPDVVADTIETFDGEATRKSKTTFMLTRGPRVFNRSGLIINGVCLLVITLAAAMIFERYRSRRRSVAANPPSQ